MDGGDAEAHARLVRIGKAVEETLAQAGVTREELAARLDLHPSGITRIINGEQNITVERVAAIEKALSMKRGALLRAGGYVDEDVTVFDLIETEDLLQEQKAALRLTLGAFLQATPPR